MPCAETILARGVVTHLTSLDQLEESVHLRVVDFPEILPLLLSHHVVYLLEDIIRVESHHEGLAGV